MHIDAGHRALGICGSHPHLGVISVGAHAVGNRANKLTLGLWGREGSKENQAEDQRLHGCPFLLLATWRHKVGIRPACIHDPYSTLFVILRQSHCLISGARNGNRDVPTGVFLVSAEEVEPN